MPIYNYLCIDCSFEFEKFHHSHQEYNEFLLEARCPECGSHRITRIPSHPGYRRDHTVKP
jgi:putative FmdB family regulatory protein